MDQIEEEVLEEGDAIEEFSEDEIMDLGPSDIQIEEGMPDDLKAAIQKYNEKHEQLIASYHSIDSVTDAVADSVDEESNDDNIGITSPEVEDNSIEIVEDDSSTQFDNLF